MPENTPEPTAETHHLTCGAPWMPSYTVDADGGQSMKYVCPVCGAKR